jgi:hypothetical protein
MLVALFSTLALLIPSTTNAQITSSYSNNSHTNPTAFTLTIYSPNNQTYNGMMPLNFTIDWTEYPTFTFPIPPAPKLYGYYAYAIDNYPEVFVSPNQSSSDIIGYSNFLVNPAFSYSINISNLANGYHKIVITASLYGDENLFFSASSSPVEFFVQNPTLTPAPTILPQSLTIAVIVVAVLVVVVSLLLYRRHRKKQEIKQY